MVTLSKIYTRGGDAGMTSLGDGARRRKDDLRIEAYGTVDEANCFLGVARAALSEAPNEAKLSTDPGDNPERSLRSRRRSLRAGAGRCALAPAGDARSGRSPRTRNRCVERRSPATHVFRAAGRFAGRGGDACRARRRAAGRAGHGSAGGAARRKRRRAGA